MQHSDTARYSAPRLERLLSINEVAELLGISREQVYRLIRRGDLEPIRVGTRARFEPAALRGYLDANREGVLP